MIEIFPWYSKYETGIEIIDRQHKKLVGLLNRLANVAVLPKEEAKESVESVFLELKSYTVYHFDTEEKIWHKYFKGDHQELRHKSTHYEFVQKLKEIEEEKERLNDKGSALSLMRFIAMWLAEHILVYDRQMAIEVKAMEAGKSQKMAKMEARRVIETEKQVFLDLVLSVLERNVSNTIALMDEMTRERELLKHLRIYAEAFAHTREGVIFTDAAGRIEEVNDAFVKITGYTLDEVKGREIVRLFGGHMQSPEFYEKLLSDLRQNGSWEGEVWQQRKNGDIFPSWFAAAAIHSDPSLTKPDHYAIIFSDISTLKEHEKELSFIAHHDPLTGLPNRLMLVDHLRLSMAQVKRRNEKLAVIYIDLDGFKEINDKYGHEAGDKFLVEVAKNLRRTLREGDMLARIGGDEFVAVLNDVRNDAADKRLFKRLLHVASKPVLIDGKMLRVTASMGVVFYPDGRKNIDGEQLIRDADRAMYEAKESGKDRYCIYNTAFGVRAMEKSSADQLKEAMQKGELELLYQPIVQLRSGRIMGAEALLRWNHPDRGLLMPAEFLPAIEHDPWLGELELWVLTRAVEQIERWNEKGFNIYININISSQTLTAPLFLKRLKGVLAPFSKEAISYLTIEVVESEIFGLIDEAVVVLEACTRHGVRLTLDDFGSGTLMLGQIDLLPADCFKTDKSIVIGAPISSRKLSMLEGIIGISNAFMRRLVAVGVESELHGTLLLKLGCEYGQGYAIAPPMEAVALREWTKQWSPPETWRKAQALSRNFFPLLYAEVGHREWLHKISAVLRGNDVDLPPLDEKSCRFGQWLEKAEKTDKRDFERLKRVHRQLHEIGNQAIAIWRMGTKKETDKYIALLTRKSEELLAELQRLEERKG